MSGSMPSTGRSALEKPSAHERISRIKPREDMSRTKQGTAMKRAALKMSVATSMPTRFLSILDFGPAELTACLAHAAALKASRANWHRQDLPLEGFHVALLFEKPSLRTRSTFQIAVNELGGHSIEPPEYVALGGRESITD